jgi:hypothetical protein
VEALVHLALAFAIHILRCHTTQKVHDPAAAAAAAAAQQHDSKLRLHRIVQSCKLP